MNSDTQRTSILLPSDLHERLVAQAQAADRSLAAEIRQAVREHVAAQPNGQPEPKQKELR